MEGKEKSFWDRAIKCTIESCPNYEADLTKVVYGNHCKKYQMDWEVTKCINETNRPPHSDSKGC